MFDSVLNMPLSSTHFALTLRINFFLIFIFGTCKANVSMAMFLESCLNVNDAKAFSYKQVTYTKKNAVFTKIDFLMFRIIRPK